MLSFNEILISLFIFFLIYFYQKYVSFDVNENKLGQDVIDELDRHDHLVENYFQKNKIEVHLNSFYTLTQSRFSKAYKLYIVEETGVNAMALPGGIILLTSGLLSLFEEKEITFSEIMGIISHEIGHLELEHHKKLMLQDLKKKYVNTQIQTVSPFSQFGIKGMMQLFNKSMSREMEFEADEYGTKLLLKSSLDSNSLLLALIQLEKFSTFPEWAEILMSHPYMDKRIYNVNKLLKGIN